MKGVVIWLTGLPSSGKSTLAEGIARRLRKLHRPCCLLDGDAVRASLVPQPGYDDQGRDDFYATLARLAALLAGQGLVVLVPATANRRQYRSRARALAPRYLEIHVDTPVETCRARDDKGLYAKARRGELGDDFPGVEASYEAPQDPDVVARGGQDDEAESRVIELLVES